MISEKRQNNCRVFVPQGAWGAAPESVEAVVEAVQADRVDGLAQARVVHVDCDVRALGAQDLRQLVPASGNMLVAAPGRSRQRVCC